MRLIDADALTEIIHGMYAEGDDPSTYHVDAEGDTLIGKFAVVDAILNMPTIQPTPQWIPITDKLPDLDKCVLATTSWETITIAERWKDTKGEENWFVSEGECNAERDDIVAWKPLPEPYKGGQMNENQI